MNKNRYAGQLSTDTYGVLADEARIAHLHLTAAQSVAADDDAVHAAITASGTELTEVTTEITNPPFPRNLTITPGGTTADVKAGNITVTGKNMADQPISEDFAFLANATAATVGAKAFKTVEKISIPAQDGAAATFKVGFGDKLGMPFMLETRPLLWATDDGVIETTAPTVTVDDNELEKNTIDLNTAMDGSEIDIYLVL